MKKINWTRIAAYIIYWAINIAIFCGSIAIGLAVFCCVFNFVDTANMIRNDGDVLFMIIIGTFIATPVGGILYNLIKEAFWELIFPRKRSCKINAMN